MVRNQSTLWIRKLCALVTVGGELEEVQMMLSLVAMANKWRY
ncbi:hypothetical protein [Aquiflexum sp. TKW24L]|nr:hypothetical protein [Aquiflexum sp. TKW24L]